MPIYFPCLRERSILPWPASGHHPSAFGFCCVFSFVREHMVLLFCVPGLFHLFLLVFLRCQGAEAFEIQHSGLANGIFMKFLKDRLLEDKKITVLLDEVAEGKILKRAIHSKKVQQWRETHLGALMVVILFSSVLCGFGIIMCFRKVFGLMFSNTDDTQFFSFLVVLVNVMCSDEMEFGPQSSALCQPDAMLLPSSVVRRDKSAVSSLCQARHLPLQLIWIFNYF